MLQLTLLSRQEVGELLGSMVLAEVEAIQRVELLPEEQVTTDWTVQVVLAFQPEQALAVRQAAMGRSTMRPTVSAVAAVAPQAQAAATPLAQVVDTAVPQVRVLDTPLTCQATDIKG